MAYWCFVPSLVLFVTSGMGLADCKMVESSLKGPVTIQLNQSFVSGRFPRSFDELESYKPKSRKRRSVVFPKGSDVAFNLGFSFPIEALSDTKTQIDRDLQAFDTNNECIDYPQPDKQFVMDYFTVPDNSSVKKLLGTTFDVDIPFKYDFPSASSRRSLEEEHADILEMAADLFTKFGANGKHCVLRMICELAESQGLPHNGLFGKAMEALFLLDYGFSSTERLYDYVTARTYGEHEGDCHNVYDQCPFSVFNLIGTDAFEVPRHEESGAISIP